MSTEMSGPEEIASYDFDMDALGFGDFITQTMAGLPDDEIVVEVMNENGTLATTATFVRGDAGVALIISFA